MKRIIIGLLIAMTIAAGAYQYQNLGSTNTIVTAKNQFLVDSAYRGPQDTLASSPTWSEAWKNGVHYFKGADGHFHAYSILDSLKLNSTYTDPIIASHATVMTAFGNSIGANTSATVPDSGYNPRTSRYVNLPLTNYSVSGTKAYDIVGSNMININPGHFSFTVMEGGINDLRSFSSANVFNAISNAFNAAIINQYLASYVSGSDASITRTGSWTTNYNFSVAGFGKTTTAAYTSTAGGIASTTVTGTSVALQIAGNVGAGATVTVVIDGVTMEVITTANQVETGSYIPMARAYIGLSNTAHTVTLNYSGSGLFILDYIGTLVSNPLLPFVVVDVPYLNFSNGTAAGSDTKIRTDTVNNRLTALVTSWRSRGFTSVYEAKTNTFYSASPGVDLFTDDVHPNNFGHYEMFQSVVTSMFTATYVDGTIVKGNNGYFYGSKLGVLTRLAYQPEINLQTVLNNGTTITSPFYINGNGFPGSINNFPQLYIDSLLWVLQTGNITTSRVNVRGVFQVNGALAGIKIFQRSPDTTKGFLLASGGGVISIYDEISGSRQLVRFDTSYRARFLNNSLSLSANPDGPSTASSVYIDGNRSGAIGKGSLKIDSSVAVVTPEKYLLENIGGFLLWTPNTLARDTLTMRGWVRSNFSLLSGAPIKYQHTIFIPTTGGTVSLVNGQYNIINPAGALLALTVNLPSSPANNDVVYIKFTQNVTTVTYGNGTVVDGITAPTAGGLTILTYDSGTTSWY